MFCCLQLCISQQSWGTTAATEAPTRYLSLLSTYISPENNIQNLYIRLNIRAVFGSQTYNQDLDRKMAAEFQQAQKLNPQIGWGWFILAGIAPEGQLRETSLKKLTQILTIESPSQFTIPNNQGFETQRNLINRFFEFCFLQAQVLQLSDQHIQRLAAYLVRIKGIDPERVLLDVPNLTSTDFSLTGPRQILPRARLLWTYAKLAGLEDELHQEILQKVEDLFITNFQEATKTDTPVSVYFDTTRLDLVRISNIPDILAKDKSWLTACRSWGSGLHLFAFSIGNSGLKAEVEKILIRELRELAPLSRHCRLNLGWLRRPAHMHGDPWWESTFGDPNLTQQLKEFLYGSFEFVDSIKQIQLEILKQIVFRSYENPALALPMCELALALPFDQSAESKIELIYAVSKGQHGSLDLFLDCYVRKKWGQAGWEQLERRRYANIKRYLIALFRSPQFMSGQSRFLVPRHFPKAIFSDPEIESEAIKVLSTESDARQSLMGRWGAKSFFRNMPKVRPLVIKFIAGEIASEINKPGRIPQIISQISTNFALEDPTEISSARSEIKRTVEELNLSQAQLEAILHELNFSDLGLNPNFESEMLKEQFLEQYRRRFPRSEMSRWSNEDFALLSELQIFKLVRPRLHCESGEAKNELISLADQFTNTPASRLEAFKLPVIRSLTAAFLKREIPPDCRNPRVENFLGLSLLLSPSEEDQLVGLRTLARNFSSTRILQFDPKLEKFRASDGLGALTIFLSQLLPDSQAELAWPSLLGETLSQWLFADDQLVRELKVLATSTGKNSRTSAFATMAKSWLKRLNTTDSRFPSVTGPHLEDERRPFFMHFNGGPDVAINYQGAESDVMTFYYGLFDQRSYILNGSGRDNLTIMHGKGMGSLDVPFDSTDISKWPPVSQKLFLKQKSSLDVPSEPLSASFENIRDSYRKVPRSTTELTVIYSGHGDDSGFGSWGNDRITARDVRNFEKDLPDKTLVRSVFVQCFAGATVVPPTRSIPKFESELSHFIDYYYPANRCALATSTEDELNRYVNEADWRDGAWKNSPWNRLFEATPIISLQTIKTQIEGPILTDGLFEPRSSVSGPISSVSVPILTSDYLIQDITRTLCSERNFKLTAMKNQEGESKWNSNAERTLKLNGLKLTVIQRGSDWDQQLADLCNSPRHKELSALHDQLNGFYTNFSRPAEAFYLGVATALIGVFYPDVQAQNQRQIEQIDRIIAERNQVEDLNTEAFLAKKNKLLLEEIHVRSQMSDEMKLLAASMQIDPRFNHHFNRVMAINLNVIEKLRDYIPADVFSLANPKITQDSQPDQVTSSQTPNLNSDAAKPPQPLVPPNYVFQLRDVLFRKYTEMQLVRRPKLLAYQKFLRSQVENLIEHPSLFYLKERYQNLRNCETSSIRP